MVTAQHFAVGQFHRLGVLHSGVSGKHLDTPALLQKCDAVGKLCCHRVLAGNDLGIVKGCTLYVDAKGVAVACFIINVGGAQQSLGGNTASVQAGAAQLVLFYQSGRIAVLTILPLW